MTVGDEEKKAVMKVIDSGILSNYLGGYHENFMGGDTVRECESLGRRISARNMRLR